MVNIKGILFRSVLSSKPSTMGSNSGGHVVTPISAITPYNNKWTVKVILSYSYSGVYIFYFAPPPGPRGGGGQKYDLLIGLGKI